MKAVLLRDLKGHIASPAGIFYSVAFLLVSGILFTNICMNSESLDFAAVLAGMTKAQILLVPFLTMGYFSEENRQGSSLLLFSAPISMTAIILGKFFAAFIYMQAVTLVTLVYLPLAGSSLAFSEIFLLYAAFALMSAVFAAICCFISSVSSNAMTSYVAAVVGLFVFYLIDGAITIVSDRGLAAALEICSVFSAYRDLTSGIFSLSAVIRMFSMVGIFLFFTRLILELRYRTGRNEWHD